MVLTLKVSLGSGMYAQSHWHAVLEIDEVTTLEELHLIIQ